MNKETITAENPSFIEKIKEIIEYEDLFFALAYKDIKVKYSQTFLGLAWVILQPLATITIFSVVFQKLVGEKVGNVPYPLFMTVGMCVWNYFAIVMQQSGTSIINAQNMVQKIYFPRLILPLSKAFVGLIDFGVSIAFLIIAMFYYQFTPSINILFAPLVLIWLAMTAIGVGFWLSGLTVKYRDMLHVLPFLVQFGLYATPVGYTISMLNTNYEHLFYINPLTGILEFARWSILGSQNLSSNIYISLAVSILVFASGIRFFSHIETEMADLL